MEINLVIFASGSGSNAEAIIQYFSSHPVINVGAVITNNPNAGVIERCIRLGVAVSVIETSKESETKTLRLLESLEANYLILAGYLKKIPISFIQAFEDKILNIHPALLPKYGGKGMYGDKVHKAVLDNEEKESGITIHLVNEIYDDGKIIFQKACLIEPMDTPSSLAQKIHALEHENYPSIIEDYVSEREGSEGDNF